MESNRKLSYEAVPKDENGWVNAKEYIPRDFDMCSLKIKDRKTKSGWAIGNKWDGLNIRPKDEILYWKKVKV